MRKFIFLAAVSSVIAHACPPALPGTWQRLQAAMVYAGHADPKAIEVCESMFATTAQSQCKERVARKIYSAGALRYCKTVSVDYAKQECLDSIENSYIADEALAICEPITSSFERANCFQQIKDKSFDSADLERCGKLAEPNRGSCLSQAGYCIQKTI